MTYANYGISRPAQVPQGFDSKNLEGFDEDEVKSLIQQELDGALGQDGGTLSQERLAAQRYYAGELPEATGQDGRSSVVMRSVLEAVEWVLPALMRIFTASDQICTVEPLRPAPYVPLLPGQPPPPDPVLLAKQATLYINHLFLKDNPGFLILRDWFADALIEKLGWVKYWWNTQQEVETKSYTGILQFQLDALLGDDPDAEVIKERRYMQEPDEFAMDRPFVPPPQPAQPQMPGMPSAPPPPPPQIELIDCTIRYTRDHGRITIANLAPEEVLFSRRAKRDDIPFLAHRRRWTYSDLIQQGFDEECLELVPMDDSMEYNSERFERYREDDAFPPYGRKDAGRELWVEESYIRLSKDGKTTELYKVTTAGHGLVILTKGGEPDIECVECVPFVSICPIPASHKLVGLSLADLTADLQDIKSSIMRQMVDNAYLSNWPRVEVADDSINENTYDDLLTLRPGGVVRSRRLGGIAPMSIPYTADKSFPLIQYIDQTQEVRTGVARNNQMIGADQLANTTASGIAMVQGAQAQRVELFARIFAYGVEQLLRGIMRLVRQNQQQERIIRVTGDWLRIDPRQWREDMPGTVSVGLGTGNRDQMLQHLMQVVQLQAQIVQQQGGPTGPLVYPQNVYDALKALQENAGFKSSFFADPSQPPPGGQAPKPEPPPNPALIVAQAQVEATKMKAQGAIQAAQLKAQSDAQTRQQQVQLEAQLAQQKQQHQLMLEEQKAQHSQELERQQAQHDLVIQRAKMENDAAVAQREFELKFAAGAYAQNQRGP